MVPKGDGKLGGHMTHGKRKNDKQRKTFKNKKEGKGRGPGWGEREKGWGKKIKEKGRQKEMLDRVGIKQEKSTEKAGEPTTVMGKGISKAFLLRRAHLGPNGRRGKMKTKMLGGKRIVEIQQRKGALCRQK